MPLDFYILPLIIHYLKVTHVVKNINICINTVPHLIFTREIIKQMSQETVTIKIASCGIDFQASNKKRNKSYSWET